MFYTFNLRKHRKKIVFFILLTMTMIISYACINLYYPLKYIETIDVKAEKYGLETSLVCSVIHAESKFNPLAESNKDARGLMQIVEMTGNWAAEEIGITNYHFDNIYDPETNIEIGCWYINRLYKQFGNMQTALIAYNAGSGNVSKWLQDENYSSDGIHVKNIPYGETKKYIKRVEFNKKIYDVLLKIYGGTYDKR